MILGSASWLGYLLIKELQRINSNYKVSGTYNNQKVDFGEGVELYRAQKLEDFKRVIKLFEPTIVVNFLRGENDEGMAIHVYVENYISSIQGYYVYASSALALDGYGCKELTESLLAYAKEGYGLFKAKAEEHLYESHSKWCILRFSSVQGYVPHKQTRNEIFLNRLINGENVSVHSGVIQNRMYADLMIKALIDIIILEYHGIVHFGTVDSSEEVNFLKAVANTFGFSEDLICASKQIRSINLNCVPKVIFNLFGNKYKVQELSTIESLTKIEAFQKYIRK